MYTVYWYCTYIWIRLLCVCVRIAHAFFLFQTQTAKKKWKSLCLIEWSLNWTELNWAVNCYVCCCAVAILTRICKRIPNHKSWNRMWNLKCLFISIHLRFVLLFALHFVALGEPKQSKRKIPSTHELTEIFWIFLLSACISNFFPQKLSSILMHNDVWFIHPYRIVGKVCTVRRQRKNDFCSDFLSFCLLF